MMGFTYVWVATRVADVTVSSQTYAVKVTMDPKITR